MKIKIDILLGFLGSGKTTFINSLLKNKEYRESNIFIIQEEKGKIKLETEKINSAFKENIEIYDIKNIIKKYSPDRILIEVNGTKNIQNFFNLFKDKYIERNCKINKIITIVDGQSAKNYLMNISEMMRGHILYSDIILINNIKDMKRSNIKDIEKSIKAINESAKIYKFKDLEEENKAIKAESFNYLLENDNNNGFYIICSLCVILLISYLTNLIYKFIEIEKYFNYIFEICKKFLGIFIETVPFILVGAVFSSILQIFISENSITKIFPKNKFLSSFAASILGIIFPICDCGTIPIARGFLKKGLPIHVAVTFMLSAPIVNPIAIISSVYAFKGMEEVVIYKILIGIIVSITVGIILSRYSSKEVVSEYIMNCQCNLCQGKDLNEGGVFNKIKNMFLVAGDEFFNVGKYMIIGILLSSIIQVLFNNNIISINSKNDIFAILIMMFFACFLSVCSSSDAFIAKGFLNSFSKNSVLGFLILGPMINIKNIIMLLGSFKSKFVFKLLFLIITVTFIFLMLINI